MGLLGRGAWARNIAATLDTIPQVTWRRVSGFESGLDAVIIANKSCDHVVSALPFLKAGLPCFIEKPVATSLRDYQMLRQAAHASGAMVFAGHLHQFNPAAQAFCATFAQIGPIRHVSGVFANCRPRDDTSVIWDWLPHPLSLLPNMFDRDPHSVTAHALAGTNRATAVRARLNYEAACCELTASWLAPEPCFEIRVWGEAGQASFDDRAARKVTLTMPRTGTCFPEYAPTAPLEQELRAFLKALQGIEPNPSPLSAAAPMIAALDAMERSAQQAGQTIHLCPDDPEPGSK